MKHTHSGNAILTSPRGNGSQYRTTHSTLQQQNEPTNERNFGMTARHRNNNFPFADRSGSNTHVFATSPVFLSSGLWLRAKTGNVSEEQQMNCRTTNKTNTCSSALTVMHSERRILPTLLNFAAYNYSCDSLLLASGHSYWNDNAARHITITHSNHRGAFLRPCQITTTRTCLFIWVALTVKLQTRY